MSHSLNSHFLVGDFDRKWFINDDSDVPSVAQTYGLIIPINEETLNLDIKHGAMKIDRQLADFIFLLHGVIQTSLDLFFFFGANCC